MIVIGLTGGIGSGKSTVSDILKEQGIPVVDGDLIAREVVEPHRPAYDEIVRVFGAEILQQDGTLNRKRIGEIVFSDPEKLSILNRITHKEIYRVILERLESLKEAGTPLVFLDVALLFETGFNQLTDWVWVVDAPDSVRVERIQKRDGLKEEEILKRIQSQMSRELRNKKGDLVLDNSKSREELKAQILQELKQYESKN
jgi:dephospho-CoA kinase